MGNIVCSGIWFVNFNNLSSKKTGNGVRLGLILNGSILTTMM